MSEEGSIEQALQGSGIAFFLTLLAFFLLKRSRFWKEATLEAKTFSFPVYHPILSFFIYIVAAAALFLFFSEKMQLSGTWRDISILLGTFLFLFGYTFFFHPITMKKIFWGKEGKPSLKEAGKDFLFGCKSWVFAFPPILLVANLTSLALLSYFGPIEEEQQAIEHLKSAVDEPYALFIFFWVLSFFTPLLEEFLFRGQMQTWLRQYLSRFWVITISSLLFVFFHYSEAQGLKNIEIIVALLPLALILGYLYERKGSLWQSIGLHCTFNFVNTLLILFLEKS